MFSGCGKAGLFYVLAVSALMMSSCVSVTSPEQVEDNMRDLLESYGDVNEVRPVWRFQKRRLFATPILAAIVLGRLDRVPELIEAGASPNFIPGASASPLECAASPERCREKFKLYVNDKKNRLVNIDIINYLLANGSDPDEKINGTYSVKEIYLCSPASDKSRKLLDIFLKYGSVVSDDELSACREQKEKHINELNDIVDADRSDMNQNQLGFYEEMDKALLHEKMGLLMIEDMERHGLKRTLSLRKNPGQYYAKVVEAKEKEEAYRKRKLGLAQEIERKKLKAKKQVIKSYITSRPDLSQAMDEVVLIGSEKKAVDSFIRKNGFGRLCETGSNNTFYQSKTCLSEWELVRRQASSHYSSLDSAYKKQRDWLAGLFGQNASIAAAILDDRVARTPSDEDIKQQYAPIEQQLIRITKSESRAERAESRLREQQQMADFMNHIQSTFERTNRMLDRNMAQTHRVVNQAYASQRVRDVNSSSGYRVRSAPVMRDLNKELEEIDRSFDASTSGRSGEEDSRQIGASSSNAGKKECVAQSESSGPKPNVPKRYCRYVFADYTDNASFGLNDYISEFMEESHSEESAKETLAFELLQEAKKKCKSKGYSRVHHNETYGFNEVAVTVGQCKESNRMGSAFYLCEGTAAFICAR